MAGRYASYVMIRLQKQFIVRTERPPASRLKRSQLLAVAVVALMVLSAVPARVASAKGGYSERLTVFTSGSIALWEMTFTGINGSSHLSALESAPGLSWYNISAISTTAWVSDMQIFGPKGYNLLPVPFVPSQGLFLTVGSDSFTDASAAASALDSYLLTSFESYSNGTGTYTFYSPITFSDLIPTTLFKFLPTSDGGFANAVSSSFFMGSDSPFLVLEGQKGSSGFNHQLELGSISTSAINGQDQPNLLGYFSSTITSIEASNQSSSSVIQLRFLDGIVQSKDKGATVTSNASPFSGSYTLDLGAGEKVSTINATVVEQPVELLASRAVDVGVLRTNDNLTVTLSLRNLSPSGTISSVAFSDTWWSKTGDFKFLSGNYTVPTSAISAGGSVTPVYRLRYTGTTTGSQLIPPSVVHYVYLMGGESFNGTATLNPIMLSLGTDAPVVYTTVTPVGTFGPSVGNTQKFNVTVTNVGTLPASSIVVAGRSVAGLAARSGSSPGGSATVSVAQSATGLLGVNTTRSYTVTYQTPSGVTLNSTSNVVSDTFSHSSMDIGFPHVSVSLQLSMLSDSKTNVTLIFTTANTGYANVTSFQAAGQLPIGLGCGMTNGTGISCLRGQLSLSYPVLNTSATETTTMKYNLTSPASFITAPLKFQGQSSGFNETGQSNSVAIPAGLLLTKQFSPAQLFGGMSSTVSVFASNAGPHQLYNMTVGSNVDSFDTLSSTETLTKTTAALAVGGNNTLSYNVTATQTFGNLTGTPATARFYFGGTLFTISGVNPKVEIYQPLTVTITTTPTTPEEGKNFTINIEITNPSGVEVSNVQFILPVPSGVGLSNLKGATLSSGSFTVSLGNLSAHGTASATATAVASSGITIPFDKAKLTFSYSGASINGIVPTGSGIAIGEDVTTRYLIPMAFVFLVLLFTAFYVRRKAAPTAPASPK